MFLIEYEGVRYIVPDLGGYPGAVVLAQAERLPDEFERIDEATGAIVIDLAARADARAGREHIRDLRTWKAAVAEMVLATGVTPTQGLLAREAAQRGVSVHDWAQVVLDRAEPVIARELQRIAEKNGI